LSINFKDVRTQEGFQCGYFMDGGGGGGGGGCAGGGRGQFADTGQGEVNFVRTSLVLWTTPNYLCAAVYWPMTHLWAVYWPMRSFFTKPCEKSKIMLL